MPLAADNIGRPIISDTPRNDVLSLFIYGVKTRIQESEHLKERPQWSRIVMKTSFPSSGSDESFCPLWCRKSLTGHFLTSSVLLFVSSSSLQSQYTQGDFPTTLPQVRSHTPTDSHTDVLSFTDFNLVLTPIRSIRRQTAWFCYPASPSACQMFCCAESPQVDSSINGRLFLKEDQSAQKRNVDVCGNSTKPGRT